MGLAQYSIALVCIALFTIAILGFAINFNNDNDAAISFSEDSDLMSLSSNANENLSDFRGGAESTYKSIVESSIEQGDTTPSGGAFAITPWSLLSTVKNIIDVGYKRIFGDEGNFGIFLTSLFGMMGLIMVFYIWKAWAGKMPD